MKKILMLLARGFEVHEASAFIDVIGWNKSYGSGNTEVITCGLSRELVSTFNLKVKLDHLISEVRTDEFEALAIPGGFEPYGFYEDAFHPDFLHLIRQFNAAGKTIATVCVGALPVGKSGILKGRTGTTYHLSGGKRQKQLAEFGVEIGNEPIVEDGNIITSRGPSTAMEAAFRLLEKLTDKENTRKIKTLMGFLPA